MGWVSSEFRNKLMMPQIGLMMPSCFELRVIFNLIPCTWDSIKRIPLVIWVCSQGRQTLYQINPCYPCHDLTISRIRISRKLIRNAEYQAPSQTYWVRIYIIDLPGSLKMIILRSTASNYLYYVCQYAYFIYAWKEL